jgi:uncharacterized protein YcfJ
MKNIVAKNIVIKTIVSTALLAAAGVTLAQSGPANAFGVVISSSPVVEQITVPKQVCTTTNVQTFQPTGGGALIGAVVGGALGNQFGRGQGRVVATAVGALGGGILGNQIESQNGYYVNQPTQQCHTQNTVENRTVAQNVLYEYAGQRYTVQMPATGDFRPGVRIALQVEAPVQAVAPVQTVTYVRQQPVFTPVAPIVYYNDIDTFAPRYVYSEPYYRPSYVRPYSAPRAVQHPVHTVRHPVQPVRHHRDRDEHRNWR